MDILEKLYEIDFEKLFPLQRKVQITYPYTIVQGSSKSGKSYLIYDYLNQFKNEQFLYIDLDDIRIEKENILYNLDRFLLNNKEIEVLAIDNVDSDFTDIFKELTTLKSIILSTKDDISFNNFRNIKLTPLDFEEYILFDNKHQNTTNSFNSFLKYGNFPEIVSYEEYKQHKRNQEIINLLTSNKLEYEILKLFILSSGEKKSIFQLFNTLKKYHKVSKDLFYLTASKFENEKLIYFCEKYEQPKAPKKIYCYNHALIDCVSYDKKFINQFANMIYCELKNSYRNIYYLDNVDFYIEDSNSIVLAIPFFLNHANFSGKILPIIEKYNIKNITIVTVSTNNIIFIDDIECEVLPFYEWALAL